MRRIINRCVITPAIIAAAGFAAPAHAQVQDTPAVISANAPKTANGSPEEIIVTAQKREQNVQDVPISMTVVSGRQIEAFHNTDLHSLQDSIPNLYVERLNFADTIYIRGFGTGPANFAFDPTVSLYVDGIYSGRPQQFTSPFFDVERVEVLRGPQGALFGKNTAAGAVSVITANPTRQAKVSATLSHNFKLNGEEFSGFMSGPLSDTLSARVSGRVLSFDGYIPNSVSGTRNPRREEALARVALRYQPAGGADFIAKVQYAKTATYGENQLMASLTVPGAEPNPVQANDPAPFGFDNAAHFEGWNGSLTGNIPVGTHTLTFVTGFSNFKAHRANSYSNDVPAIFLNRINEKFKQYSGEVRIASPADQPLSYIVGVYYDWHRYHVAQPFNYNIFFGFVNGSTEGDLYQSGNSYSAFAQATYRLGSAARLIGSLRYTKVDKTGFYAASNTGFPLLGAPFTESGKINEHHLDPSVTAQFDVTPDVMLYATYARGSKSGGFVGNNVKNFGTALVPVLAPFTFKPEESRSFEIGLKTTFADKRATFDIALYDTKIKDLQTSVFCATCAGGGFVTKNAGSATSKGVEASLSWRPVDALRLSLTGAYLDAKYDDFLGANCLASQPTSVCDPSAAPSAPNSVQFNNLAGYRLTFSSKWTGNAQASYVAPVGSAMKLTTTVRAGYRSRYFNSDDQSPVFGIQKGFTKVDARLELAAVNDRWSVAVVGKNITNRHTYSFANAWPFPLTYSPTAQKYLDEPRTITAEASVRF